MPTFFEAGRLRRKQVPVTLNPIVPVEKVFDRGCDRLFGAVVNDDQFQFRSDWPITEMMASLQASSACIGWQYD